MRILYFADYPFSSDEELKLYIESLPNDIRKYEMEYYMYGKSKTSFLSNLGYSVIIFSPIPYSFTDIDNVSNSLLMLKYGGISIIIPIAIFLFLAFVFWSL